MICYVRRQSRRNGRSYRLIPITQWGKEGKRAIMKALFCHWDRLRFFDEKSVKGLKDWNAFSVGKRKPAGVPAGKNFEDYCKFRLRNLGLILHTVPESLHLGKEGRAFGVVLFA